MNMLRTVFLILGVAVAGCGEHPEYVGNGPAQREALGVPSDGQPLALFNVSVGGVQFDIPAWMLEQVVTYTRPVVRGKAEWVVVITEWPNPRPYYSQNDIRVRNWQNEVSVELQAPQLKPEDRKLQDYESIIKGLYKGAVARESNFQGGGLTYLQYKNTAAGAIYLAPKNLITHEGQPVYATCRAIRGVRDPQDDCFVSFWFDHKHELYVTYRFKQRHAGELVDLHRHVVSFINSLTRNQKGMAANHSLKLDGPDGPPT